jgi:hypothetical protein
VIHERFDYELLPSGRRHTAIASRPQSRDDARVQSVDEFSVPAVASSAALSRGGNCLFLRPARRRIPRADFSLNEYLESTFVSRTSDNEDTTASLWNSEVLSVKHPPDCGALTADTQSCGSPPVLGHGWPDPSKSPQHGGEILTSVGAESTGYVFPDNPLGIAFLSNAALVPEQSRPFACQASTVSSN